MELNELLHDALVVRIANVSPATNGHPCTRFDGPGRRYAGMNIPLSTLERPFTAVPNSAPLTVAKFLLDRYGGLIPQRGTMGLRPWYSETPTPAPEDLDTVKLIKESMEIQAGKRPPPPITQRSNQPWRGHGPTEDIHREDIVPSETWGESELQSLIDRNRLDVPRTLPWKDRVARAKRDIELLVRRGDAVAAPLRGAPPE